MWRGPMWVNTNYHVVLGLLAQAEPERYPEGLQGAKRLVDEGGGWRAGGRLYVDGR